MATNVAQESGNRVRKNDASLLRMSRLRHGALKHQAAVSPASHNESTVMPENAVEECPEGNDVRPFTTSLGSLCCIAK